MMFRTQRFVAHHLKMRQTIVPGHVALQLIASTKKHASHLRRVRSQMQIILFSLFIVAQHLRRRPYRVLINVHQAAMRNARTNSSASQIPLASTRDHFIVVQVGQMPQRVVPFHAQVDPRPIVLLVLHVSHQHPVTRVIHSSAVKLLKMLLHHVLFPVHWVKVTNAPMAKVVFHTRFVMKMERMQLLHHHSTQFLRRRLTLIIVG